MSKQLVELHDKAVSLLQEEKEEMTVELLKERIVEIESMERLLTKAREQYKRLLSKTVDDIYYGDDGC